MVKTFFGINMAVTNVFSHYSRLLQVPERSTSYKTI